MWVIVTKKVLSNQINYPDSLTLFTRTFRNPDNDTEFVTFYSGDQSAADMGVTEYTGDYFPRDPDAIRVISIGALDERFTLGEAAAIEDSTVPTIKVLRTRLGRKAYIDLDDPKFDAALDALVIAGLLTAERKTEMLVDGTEAEAYRGVL